MSISTTSSAAFVHDFVVCSANRRYPAFGYDWMPSLTRSADPMSLFDTGELPPHENQSATPVAPFGFVRTTLLSVAPFLSAAWVIPSIFTFETAVGTA